MDYITFDGEFVNSSLHRSQGQGSERIQPRILDAVFYDKESGKIFISRSKLERQGLNPGVALNTAKGLLISQIKEYKDRQKMPEIVIDLGEKPDRLDLNDLQSQSFLDYIKQILNVSVRAKECKIFHGEGMKSTKGVYFT